MMLVQKTLLAVAIIGSVQLIFARGKDSNLENSSRIGTEVPLVRSMQVSLANQENNAVKTLWPSIGCWFWTDDEFKPEGYTRIIDLFEKYSPFRLLTASLRCPGELTDAGVHSQIKAASEYARKKGLGIVMDLDVRLARDLFREHFPDELQEILLLREFPLKDTDSTVSIVKSPVYSDHYTSGRTSYYPVKSRLLRIYSYEKDNGQIKAGTLADITNCGQAGGNKDQLVVSVNNVSAGHGRTACALVAVTINTPDIFAPHLLPYQRQILKQYADASLAGACKDEWGFPGRFNPPTNELWYSKSLAEEYEKRCPGHELLRDMLLMSVGEQGKETERLVAVNNYMEMYFQRNSQIETDFYDATKEFLGQTVMVATHPTWFPYPDVREVFKNGLSWWGAKRDLAQTDEATPYCVRTALAKKWRSPLWYNMFYSDSIESYSQNLWCAVLGGGRLNYHPLYPSSLGHVDASIALLKGNLLRAESRIGLLNYISQSPVYCPVAVIFGHPSALNWCNGNGFAKVGLDLTDRLWQDGYYADLIPSSEIVNGALKIGPNGKVEYGAQQYEAVVYYNPECDHASVATFFGKVARQNKTALFRVGKQTMDFEGNAVDSDNSLPAAMDSEKSIQAIISCLKSRGIQPQTPCVMRGIEDFPPSMMPKRSGHVRLIDGTFILASGEKNIMGDSIKTSFKMDGITVNVDAVGVVALRLDKSGKPVAIACGGLKSIGIGSFNISLPERMDIAVFKDKNKWRGIVYGHKGLMPESLTRITKNWTHIREVTPYSE